MSQAKQTWRIFQTSSNLTALQKNCTRQLL